MRARASEMTGVIPSAAGAAASVASRISRAVHRSCASIALEKERASAGISASAAAGIAAAGGLASSSSSIFEALGGIARVSGAGTNVLIAARLLPVAGYAYGVSAGHCSAALGDVKAPSASSDEHAMALSASWRGE